MAYLAELQETRAAVREHGGEFNSFSRVLTGVLVRWGGTRGVSVTDLRTNLRSPPFLAKPGTHFDRLRVRAGGFEVFAGAEELVSLVLHGRQLLGEGRDLDGRGHHGRSVTVVRATRHRRASSCQFFFRIFQRAGRARVERPRIELNRRAISFVSIFPIDYVFFATCSSKIPSDSFPFEVEPDFCVTGSDLPADHKKSFPHFYRFLRFGDLRAPCAEHYSVTSAHRETPWRPPQQVSRRPRANPHRSRRVRGPRRLGPRFPFFGPLVIFSFAKGRNFCWR